MTDYTFLTYTQEKALERAVTKMLLQQYYAGEEFATQQVALIRRTLICAEELHTLLPLPRKTFADVELGDKFVEGSITHEVLSIDTDEESGNLVFFTKSAYLEQSSYYDVLFRIADKEVTFA